MDETSQLFTIFDDKQSSKTKVNLLVAVQRVEMFAMVYAEKHLLANGTYNSTTVSTGHHLGEKRVYKIT